MELTHLDSDVFNCADKYNDKYIKTSVYKNTTAVQHALGSSWIRAKNIGTDYKNLP